MPGNMRYPPVSIALPAGSVETAAMRPSTTEMQPGWMLPSPCNRRAPDRMRSDMASLNAVDDQAGRPSRMCGMRQQAVGALQRNAGQMSRYWSRLTYELKPYVPGEQPR